MARTRKGRWDYKPEAWKHPSKSTGCMVFVILFMGLFASTMFVSCTKEEVEELEVEVNPYAGTKWSKSYENYFGGSDYMYVLEFAETEFSYYEADANGRYKSGMTQGKYTYSGNKITINNVKNKTTWLNEYITGATVSGSLLTLHTYWISSDGERFDDTMQMAKWN